MRILVSAVLVFFILTAPAISFSSSGEEQGPIISKALEGQEMLFARRYYDALKLFSALSKDYPDSPAGPFGEMALYEVRMLEQEDFHLKKQYEDAAKEGIGRVGRILQRYHPDTWDLFLSGSLLGLDGFFKARKGQWWDAYVAGTRSRQLFRRVKELDPKFVDADFGLGMYIYWRSVYSRDLWFLNFIPNRRKEGLEIVGRVARDGHFAKELARVSLAVMYMEEKRYGDAGKVLEEYVSRYPENVILRMFLGRVYVALKKYDDAIAQFRQILEVDPSLRKPHYFIGAALVLKRDPNSYTGAESELKAFLRAEGANKYWSASAHYWLGRLAEVKGDKKTARGEYETALKQNPKIKGVVERIRGLGSGL